MSPLLVSLIGAVARSVLLSIGAALVSRQVLSADQVPQFVEQFSGPLVGVVLMVGALGWSLWQKWWAHLRERAVRELPAGADDEQLADRMRDLLLRPGE